MLDIMEWLFDAWPIFLGISTAIGIISALFTFKKELDSNENRPVAIRLLGNLTRCAILNLMPEERPIKTFVIDEKPIKRFKTDILFLKEKYNLI